MLEYDNIRLELESYEEPVATLRESLHIEHTLVEISELEARTQEPEFWNDVEKAQKLQTSLKRLQKKVESFNNLSTEREDLLALCELGNEAEDTDTLAELQEGVDRFKSDFEKMRLETLLTGEYDKNNAILTLHAGAGGTEAQDWVSMLYRMYTRWAEMHDFEVRYSNILMVMKQVLRAVPSWYQVRMHTAS